MKINWKGNLLVKVCESDVKSKWKAIWHEDNFPLTARSISCSVWFTAKPVAWWKCQNGIYFKHQRPKFIRSKFVRKLNLKTFINPFIWGDAINPEPFWRDKSWHPFLFITQLSVNLISASATPPTKTCLNKTLNCKFSFFPLNFFFTVKHFGSLRKIPKLGGQDFGYRNFKCSWIAQMSLAVFNSLSSSFQQVLPNHQDLSQWNFKWLFYGQPLWPLRKKSKPTDWGNWKLKYSRISHELIFCFNFVLTCIYFK